MQQAFTVMKKILARNHVVRLYRTVYLLTLLGYGIFLQLKGSMDDYVGDAEAMMYMAVVGFGFFLYMGYEIGHQSHILSSRLQPGNSPVPLSEIPGGSLGCTAAALWHLLLSALASFVIALLVMQTMGNVGDPGYLSMDRMVASSNSACFLYYFLVPMTGGLMGMAISRLLENHRMIAFVVIGALILLPHGMMDYLVGIFSLGIPEDWGLDVYYWIKDWFVFSPYRIVQLWSHANQPGIDSVYGIPQETARWFQMLFWVFLSLAAILPTVTRSRKKKRIMPLAAGALALVMAVAFSGKGALATEDNRPVDTVWKTEDQFTEASRRAPGYKAGFTVESYDMELTMGHKLSAYVKMTVSTPEETREQYYFTLHENMHIVSLTDEMGRKIPHVRQGNLLCFDKEQLPDGGVLKLTYSGSLPVAYANDQATALPAWYPYYPKAGIAYNDLEHNNEPILNDELVSFTVRVNAPYMVACSLPGENNSFSGDARGISLMGSRTMTTVTHEDGMHYHKGEVLDDSWTRIFSQKMASDVDGANVRMGCDMNKPWLPALGEKYRNVFVIPDSWRSAKEEMPNVIFCGDHVWISEDYLIDADNFAVEYIRNCFHEDHRNSWLTDAFTNYILNLDRRGGPNIDNDPEYLIRQMENYFASNYYYSKDASMLMMYMSMDYVVENGGSGSLIKFAEYLSQPVNDKYVNEYHFMAELMKSVKNE